MKRMFQKTYLDVDFAKNKLEIDGVLKENQFWVEIGSREAMRGKYRVFEKLSHQPYKTENTHFCGLGSREISREKHY